jgi:predicted metal-dependent hydrolase
MPVQIDQIIRSKRKTVAIVVRPDASVIVRAPLRATRASILEFVEKNTAWIEKKQAQARETALPAPREYVAGARFEYLGNEYLLEIVQGQKKSLLMEDGKFKLAMSARQAARLAFERWYREQARKIISERVDYYVQLHGFQYSRLGITSARTRWGSCSASGALNFSWRLIQAPIEVVDYVVVHELVHTVIHNHSGRFWKRVEQTMPDYRERRTWLRKNGLRLLL